MKSLRFVAIDFETTGLDGRRDSIIEFGAARVEGGKVSATFSRLARPDRPLPEAIARLTGITDAELAKAPRPAEALSEFLNFIGDDPLVAHNASFEAGFLKTALAQTALKPPMHADTRRSEEEQQRQSGKPDIGVHRRSSAVPSGSQLEILDSLELSRIVLPEAQSHALGRIAATLGLAHSRLHRAEADAELTARLWLVLVEKLGALPLPVLAEMNWLVGPLGHPLAGVLHQAERAAVQRDLASADAEPRYETLFESGEAPRPRAAEEDEELPEPGRLDDAQVSAALGADGELARVLPGFEVRPEQIEMCQAVSAAFTAGRHLVVEAGTGVGKSLAYLLPAAAWAAACKRRVVISTNTKNLQSQLFGKDIPLLEKALGRSVKAAVLKGRGNYLCLRKLLYVLREAASELDYSERTALLPVLAWAPRTTSGDLSECSPLHVPEARDLVGKLTTDGPDCLGRACRQRRRCFLFAARARAQAADIVVANHALVLSDLESDSPILPPYAEAVFDEAHNLEGAGTDSLSVQVGIGRFYRTFNRLFKFRRRGRTGASSSRRRRGGAEDEPSGTGLLPSIFEQVGRAGSKVSKGLLRQLEDGAREGCRLVVVSSDAATEFINALNSLWTGFGARDKLRYSAASRRADLWEGPIAAKEKLIAALGRLKARLVRMVEDLDSEEAEDLLRADEIARDLAGAVGRLEELIGDVEFTVRGDEAGFVFWAEMYGREPQQPELHGAPLEVGPQLAHRLWHRKRSCILSSATMTVAGRFDYLVGRLGLDVPGEVPGSEFRVPGSENEVHEPEVEYEEPPDDDYPRRRQPGTRNQELGTNRFGTLLLGTPFDFSRQARVLVPSWLSEPGYAESGRNSTELSAMLGELFRATHGRGLVLFTSYAALDEVHRELRPELEPDGIAVLAQGRDGSRESLLAAIHGDAPVVVLGASSFWEGVDVRGPALSCLVIARLPFQVHTDPLFQARAELVEARGHSSFMDYSLPEAVLKFRQGFGRLIRSKTDRGVAVLADRRLLSKRYGATFLRSLPCKWRTVANSEALAGAVREFFGSE